MVHLCELMISPGVFFIYSKFWFSGLLGGKRKKKNGPKCEKIMSVVFHISGSIHHVIVIFGAHVSNDDISRYFFYFSKILIFLVVSGGGGGVKWQKMAQNVKTFCVSHFVSQELYLIWLWVLVHLCKMRISPATFFIFSTFLFFGFLGGW